MTQAMYFLKDDAGVIWSVAFTVHEADFDNWLPIFERSIESFSVLPE